MDVVCPAFVTYGRGFGALYGYRSRSDIPLGKEDEMITGSASVVIFSGTEVVEGTSGVVA